MIYCISHSRDLDGYSSGAIVKMAMSEKNSECVSIGYDYGQPFPYDKITPGKPIVMIDVSLPMEEMEKVAAYSNYAFTWIDHHISAINDYNDYIRHQEKFLTAVLDNSKAACEIAWGYYFPDRGLPEAIELLGKYDTWRENDTEYWQTDILPFQYGMRLKCNSPETFPYNVLKDHSYVRDIIAEGKIILSYQRQVDKAACRGSFELKFKGYSVIAMNGGGFSSNAFASVYDEAKHDIMMPFKYDGKKWVFSLYTTKDIDCSAIAKEFGGGGHYRAAGMTLTQEQALAILNNLS